MTPDDLRALASEATAYRSKPGNQSGYRAHKWFEHHDLDLALLCADLADALERIRNAPVRAADEYPLADWVADVAAVDAALASLEELGA